MSKSERLIPADMDAARAIAALPPETIRADWEYVKRIAGAGHVFKPTAGIVGFIGNPPPYKRKS